VHVLLHVPRDRDERDEETQSCNGPGQPPEHSPQQERQSRSPNQSCEAESEDKGSLDGPASSVPPLGG
jgi:hypothetical protein